MILQVTIQTIRNYEREGMPVTHIGRGKLPRYEEDKVIAWIKQKERA